LILPAERGERPTVESLAVESLTIEKRLTLFLGMPCLSENWTAQSINHEQSTVSEACLITECSVNAKN